MKFTILFLAMAILLGGCQAVTYGPINMATNANFTLNSGYLHGIPNTPSATGDAINKYWANQFKLNKSGDTMAGNLSMGTNHITGLGNPDTAQDAATKAYVDSRPGGGSGGYTIQISTTATTIDAAWQNGTSIDSQALTTGDMTVLNSSITAARAYAGAGTILIRNSGHDYNMAYIWNVSGLNNWSIRGEGFPVLDATNNPYNTSTSGGDCISFESGGACDNFVIEGLYIKNAKRVAIMTGTGTGNHIRRNKIYNFSLQAINLKGYDCSAYGNEVDGGTITNRAGYGILFGAWCENCAIYDNKLRNIQCDAGTRGAIEQGYSGRNNAIYDNIVIDSTSGIIITPHSGSGSFSEHTTVYGNTITNMSSYGIYVSKSSENFYTRDVIISGNYINKTGSHGIYLLGVDGYVGIYNPVVLGNTICNADYDGTSSAAIAVSYTIYPAIKDNVISGAPIGIKVSQNNTALLNNYVFDVDYDAVQFSSGNTWANVTVDGLKCDSIGRDAIRALHANNYPRIRNVHGYLKSGVAINSKWSGTGTIANGQTSGTVTHGIRLQTTASYVPTWFTCSGSGAATSAITATQVSYNVTGAVSGARTVYVHGSLGYE